LARVQLRRRREKVRIRSRAVPALPERASPRKLSGLGGRRLHLRATARRGKWGVGEPSGVVVRVRAEQSRLSRAVPWGRAGRRKRLKSGTWGGGLEGNRAGGRGKKSAAAPRQQRRPSPVACAHA